MGTSQSGKRDYLFRISVCPGNFPVRRTKKTFTIYIPTGISGNLWHMVNNRYFLLSEEFLWWPSLSPWKGRDQGTLPTEPFFRLLEFWVLYSRKTLLKSKKISVEHALHVARIHGQQGFRPRYVFNYPLSLYYSMQKKIDLHQIRANF